MLPPNPESAVPSPEILSNLTLEDIAAMPDGLLSRWILAMQQMPSAVQRITDEYGRATTEAFITEILGEVPTEAALRHGITVPWTDGQELIFKSFRENKRTAVHSGNGIGKSRACAWLVLAALYEVPNTVVVTTAPTARQVENVLWGEVRAMRERSKTPLPGRGLLTRIDLGEQWYAYGYTARIRVGDSSATAFQGTHAGTGRVVVLVDEATDIAEQMWQAIARITISPRDRVVAIGNVTDPAAYFAKIGNLRRPNGDPLWNLIVLSGEDHPNVVHNDSEIIPGAVSAEFIQDILDETGSKDSAYYRSAVLGVAPGASEDTLIEMKWIAACHLKRARAIEDALPDQKTGAPGKRRISSRRGRALGVDVAGQGTDLTIVSSISEDEWEIPLLPRDALGSDLNPSPYAGRRTWLQGRDPMEVADLVVAACAALKDVRVICIDDTGVGAGVSARLRQLQREGKLPQYRETDGRLRDVWIIEKNFGAGADDEGFALVKDELWWNLRESVRATSLLLPSEQEMRQWGLPRGNDLVAQITTPIYDRGNEEDGKRIYVYDKRDAHGRKHMTRHLPSKSPDIAHSCMLANHGYSKLRPDRAGTIPPPRNIQEYFEQRTNELKAGKTAGDKRRHAPATGTRKPNAGPTPPWARGNKRR